jgi:hypothetical protein
MTAEHVTLIGAGDLIALRIICSQCRASLSLQLNETVRVPTECPVCAAGWRNPKDPMGQTEAERLARAIKTWQDTERQNQHNFALKFEMSGPIS